MSDHGHDSGPHEPLPPVTHDHAPVGPDTAGFSIGAAIHSAEDMVFDALDFDPIFHRSAPHDPQADAAAVAEILLWQLNGLSLESVTNGNLPRGRALRRSEILSGATRRFRPSAENTQMSYEARSPSSLEEDASHRNTGMPNPEE